MGDCSVPPLPTLRAAEDCTLNACPSARLLDMKRVSAGINVTLESLQCTTRTTPVVLYIEVWSALQLTCKSQTYQLRTSGMYSHGLPKDTTRFIALRCLFHTCEETRMR